VTLFKNLPQVKEAIMTRVTATEFKNNIGAFSNVAMKEPVIVTNHQRDCLVLLSADEYSRLTGEPQGLTEERKREIREQVEYHRNTIIELSNR